MDHNARSDRDEEWCRSRNLLLLHEGVGLPKPESLETANQSIVELLPGIGKLLRGPLLPDSD